MKVVSDQWPLQQIQDGDPKGYAKELLEDAKLLQVNLLLVWTDLEHLLKHGDTTKFKSQATESMVSSLLERYNEMNELIKTMRVRVPEGVGGVGGCGGGGGGGGSASSKPCHEFAHGCEF